MPAVSVLHAVPPHLPRTPTHAPARSPTTTPGTAGCRQRRWSTACCLRARRWRRWRQLSVLSWRLRWHSATRAASAWTRRCRRSVSPAAWPGWLVGWCGGSTRACGQAGHRVGWQGGAWPLAPCFPALSALACLPPPTHPTPLSPLLPAVNLPRPPTAYNLFTNAHIHQARQGLGPAPAGSEIMLRLSGGWQPGRAGPGQLCWPPRACRRPIAASGAAGRLTRPHYVHPAQRCGGLPPSWRSLSSSWRRRRSCERPPGSPALPCPALLRLLACHARGGKRVR